MFEVGGYVVCAYKGTTQKYVHRSFNEVNCLFVYECACTSSRIGDLFAQVLISGKFPNAISLLELPLA